MSSQSSIEWTDATWNPVRGCTKISPGCKYCYAEVFAERFRGVVGHSYERGFDLRLVPEKLAEPLRWGKSRMIFVNSMSDLFHERVPDHYIVKVAEVMSLANWHVFKELTKRAERMQKLLQKSLTRYGRHKNKPGHMLEGNTYDEFHVLVRGSVPARAIRDNCIANIGIVPELAIL